MGTELEIGRACAPGFLARKVPPRRAFAGPEGSNERLRQNFLLGGHQASGHAAPENPPFGPAKLVIAMMDFPGKQLPGLRHSPIVHRKTKPRPQRKSKQVQPARLMQQTASASRLDC